jgi:hypothetical protein
MRYGFLLVSMVMFAGAARGDEASARKLVEAAIHAQGGAATLASHPVVTLKTEGIFQGYKEKPVFFHKSESTRHGSDRYRSEMWCDLTGAKLHVVNVLDDQQGWVKQSAMLKSGESLQTTEKCTPDQLARFKEAGYVDQLTTSLGEILGSDYSLKLEGEATGSKSALDGVRVSRKSRRDVILYFDKETHLLKSIVHRGTAGTDDEGTVEVRIGRYEEFQGMQMPISWEIWLNDRCLWSHHVVERNFAKTPLPGMFAKP